MSDRFTRNLNIFVFLVWAQVSVARLGRAAGVGLPALRRLLGLPFVLYDGGGDDF